MHVIGLTGGIGSGKSTVSQFIQQSGISVIDLDKISRDVVAPNSLGLKQLTDSFGTDILLETGQLNRAQLKHIIFNNIEDKQKVESILHPLIRTSVVEKLAKLSALNEPLAVVEIPLLAETGKPDYIDEVVVCDCSKHTQVQRVKQRDQLDSQLIEKILANQASREQRLALADYQINTELPLKELRNRVEHWLTEITKAL